MKKVLVVSLCKYELHESEFVRPVLNILIDNCINYSFKNYKDINSDLVEYFDKIILCGTGLLDNDFLNNLNNFNWILNYNGDILGICAGMQILGLVYGGNLKKKTEIGFYSEEFNFNFLGLTGKKEVYHLHNNYICDWEKIGFKVYSTSNIPQAVKRNSFYGVLFHPEIRNKDLILNFLKL